MTFIKNVQFTFRCEHLYANLFSNIQNLSVKATVFRDVAPFNLVDNDRRSISVIRMIYIISTETSVLVYQSIPKDSRFHICVFDNLQSPCKIKHATFLYINKVPVTRAFPPLNLRENGLHWVVLHGLIYCYKCSCNELNEVIVKRSITLSEGLVQTLTLFSSCYGGSALFEHLWWIADYRPFISRPS